MKPKPKPPRKPRAPRRPASTPNVWLWTSAGFTPYIKLAGCDRTTADLLTAKHARSVARTLNRMADWLDAQEPARKAKR